MQGREPSGAEHEFRSALGIRAGIPLALFEPTFEERATALRRREFRADAATTIPATGTGTTVAPIQPAIFARSIAPMLGIDMPAVGSGAYSTLTVTTALTAAVKAKGGAQGIDRGDAHRRDGEPAAHHRPAVAADRGHRGRW